MKSFSIQLFLLCLFAFVNNSLQAQTITPIESRCVNTGEIIVSGTIGAGGPYQDSIIGAPPQYVNTGIHYLANLPDTFEALYPGTYTLKVIDGHGGVFTYPDINITSSYVLPGSNDYQPTTTAVTNCAAPNGSIQGTLTNGRLPYNYTIISGPAQVGVTNTIGTFTGLPTGNYEVQAGDSCQNLQTRNVTITSNLPAYTITGGTINKISCDSFSLDGITVSPALPAGVSYEIVDHYTGDYTDVTSTSLPFHFKATNNDITGGYIQIILSNGCGIVASTDAIRTVANDWTLTSPWISQNCTNGVVLHSPQTTGTIPAPYIVTVQPYYIDASGNTVYITPPQTVTNYPYTLTGVDGATNPLYTNTVITDACGITKQIGTNLSFALGISSSQFDGCSNTRIDFYPTGDTSTGGPVIYSISPKAGTGSSLSGGYGFDVPDGDYTVTAIDACGRTASTQVNIDHSWKVFTFGTGTNPSCNQGGINLDLNIPVRAMGPITYNIYTGGLPVATGATPIATQTANNNGMPSPTSSDGTGEYVEFNDLTPGTYSVVATDACGRADTASFTNFAGHAPVSHTTTVKNKCINKGDIFATFYDDSPQPIIISVQNINAPGVLISNINTQLNTATDTLVASDLPVGTYIVTYSPEYCSSAFAVYDTVTITPYVQPTVTTVQSFTPCSGGGTPVILAATGGISPYMYQVINSTPSGYSDPAQSSPVFTLPTSQSTVTVRVLDACLNSTTKTVAITKATSPIIRSSIVPLTTCTLPLNFNLYIDSLYNGSVFTWIKLTGPDAGSTALSNSPILPLTYNSIADTATYEVTVTVPGTCYNVSSAFDVTGVTTSCSPSLSGNILDDANGLIDSIVNGNGTNAGGTLNAILVNTSNQVVATTSVNANGTYSFINAPAGNYSVVLSTTTGIVGNTPPASSLPTGWVNTGENLGMGIGNDGTVNGILTGIIINTTSVSNADFGIDQIPVANNITDTTQVNPGSSIQVTVPTLTGIDAEDGTYDGISGINTIIIKTLPTNGTLYYNGTAIPANDTIVDYNPSLLTVDPDNGALTVTLTYNEVDEAGIESAPATVTIPFTTLTLSGNVFDDANGLTDNTVNGAGTNANGTLYAQLINSSNIVVATVPVASDGTYSFTGLTAGTYSVVLDTSSVASSVADLASGWVNTGENIGTGAGNDGNPNGILPNIVLTTTSIANADFGIDQLPTANNVTSPAQVNPGGNATVQVPVLNGSDPEDGTYNGSSGTNTIVIDTLPTNGTLYYNGNPVNTGDTIKNYNPTLLTVDPVDSATTVIISYSEIDSAGKASAPATVTIPFTTLTLNGNVFDDANGLTDNTVNGTGTNDNGVLYAQLVDNSNTVIATVPVASGGTYSFTGLTAGTYSVVLDTSSVASSVADLASGWVNTGENIGTGAGNDGNPNGILPNIVLTTTSIANADFGIDQLPNSDDKIYTITSPLIRDTLTLDGSGILPGPLSGSDPEDGILGTNKTVVITTVPNNADLYYDGTLISNNTTINNYDSSKLQIVFTTGGSTSTSFQYAYVDSAGEQDSTPATYTITWMTPLPVTLVDFIAVKDGSMSNLSWTTSQEINSSYFDVEKSIDNVTFASIGQVTAEGNSIVTTNYIFTDKQPINGINYYRLKLVDKSGQYSFSKIQTVDFSNSSVQGFALIPNPARYQVTLSLNQAFNSKASIKIFNMQGEVVLQDFIMMNEQKHTMNLETLPVGIYKVMIIDGSGSSYIQQLEIQK